MKKHKKKIFGIHSLNGSSLMRDGMSAGVGTLAIYASDWILHKGRGHMHNLPMVGPHIERKPIILNLAVAAAGIIAMEHGGYMRDAGLVVAAYQLSRAGYTHEKICAFTGHPAISDDVLSSNASELSEAINNSIEEHIASARAELSGTSVNGNGALNGTLSTNLAD